MSSSLAPQTTFPISCSLHFNHTPPHVWWGQWGPMWLCLALCPPPMCSPREWCRGPQAQGTPGWLAVSSGSAPQPVFKACPIHAVSPPANCSNLSWVVKKTPENTPQNGKEQSVSKNNHALSHKADKTPSCLGRLHCSLLKNLESPHWSQGSSGEVIQAFKYTALLSKKMNKHTSPVFLLETCTVIFSKKVLFLFSERSSREQCFKPKTMLFLKQPRIVAFFGAGLKTRISPQMTQYL